MSGIRFEDELPPALDATHVGAEPLARLFAAIDTTYFHPHDMTMRGAIEVAGYRGRDVYLVGLGFVSYGLLRGWDEGYAVPSLGVAVRRDVYGRGHGRSMMDALEAVAIEREAPSIRLRVHPDNERARRLYEARGYRYAGEERGELVMLLDL